MFLILPQYTREDNPDEEWEEHKSPWALEELSTAHVHVPRAHRCPSLVIGDRIGRALEGQVGNQQLLLNGSVLLAQNTEGKTSWWWHRLMELFIRKLENTNHNVKR